jgi:SpoVK/Ycf46/Vps4 family AAA+-type ATPase
VQADRRLAQAGVIASRPTYHMVFEGGAGTGKTTVARIIGELFHCLGILERSNVTEVVPTRHLIGRYIGQTEKQTSQAIEQAMGGVLFIDEAYQMAPENDANDFGPRALETLLAALENHRSSFVTIFAGYTADMERLLDQNPGLRSRVPHRIAFPDYSPEEIGLIAADLLARSWQVDGDLVRDVATRCYLAIPVEERGNARWARTFAERIEQAHRRWILEHDVSGDELVRIRDEVVRSFLPEQEQEG